MSRALQLDAIAEGLLKLGLAKTQGSVSLGDGLDRLSEQADRPTLVAIARVLLQASPPSWLRFVVRNGQVIREYMPSEDLENLAWIEPELDELLLDSHEVVATREDDGFLKAMGNAAELFVFSALKYSGANPLHVARLSDGYGYDIECPGKKIDRIEVKAASRVSQEKFHISRNEFEKSSRYGLGWRLIQVVFSSEAFVSERLNASHVENVRELRHGLLQDLVPDDTKSFKWMDSAKISTTPEAWRSIQLPLDPHFSIEGFMRCPPNVLTITA